MSKYNIELPTATLNKSGIATFSGWLTIYSVKPQLREFKSASMEYLQLGVGLPALSYADKPELPADGYALVRSADGKRWEMPADYRGRTVYSTETKQQEIVAFIGELPGSLTFTPPASQYDKWDGEQWVTDTETQHAAEVAAAEQKRDVLLAEAQAVIAAWQTELQLGIIRDEDKASLIDWMKYIKTIKDVDISTDPAIIWPEKP